VLLGGGGEHLGVAFYRPEKRLRVDDEVLPLLQVRRAAESQRQEQQQGGATPQGRLAG